MASKTRKKKSDWPALLVGGILIVVLALGMALALDEVASGKGEYRRTVWDWLVGRTETPVGRAQVSVQLAKEVCRQRVIERIGADLLQTRFDQRSSRYNTELEVHTIFLDLTVRGKEGDDVYARCDVSAVNRLVLEFRVQNYREFIWGPFL